MLIINRHSPNFSERKKPINSIVLHYTGMQTLEAALERMTNKEHEVSAHYCISKEGVIYQLVPDNKKAWHAGKSHWRGVDSLNENSIGIEIENKGHEFGYENFTDIQMKSVIKLCQELIKNYKIKPQNIIAHSDIAPERKEDPGELFDWKLLAQNGVGIYHNLKFKSSEYESIRDITEDEINKLSEIGYRTPELQNLRTSENETEVPKFQNFEVQKIIIAFYRRFFPQRILLSQNHQHPENIFWDDKASKILDNLFSNW